MLSECGPAFLLAGTTPRFSTLANEAAIWMDRQTPAQILRWIESIYSCAMLDVTRLRVLVAVARYGSVTIRPPPRL